MIFGNSKYNALGPFAILSVLTQSVIEKVQIMMVDQRFNSTRYVNESLAPWNISSIPTDAYLDLNDLAQLNGSTDGIRTITVEEWPDLSRPIRPIHIATTVMFLSGIFHVRFVGS
jgi:MFS superfamily sulfate permease-like transporter